MLWIDKHRPQTLDALTFHAGGEVVGAQLLRRMACRRDLPHLLVHGPPGAGRKTRVAALLRAVYGAGAARTRVETKAVPLSSSASSAVVEVAVVSSNFHVEVCPADAGPTHDRAVVQSLVKDVAQTRPLLISSSSSSDTAAASSASSSARASASASASASVSYKVVVVHDADRLSRAAQDALRRTMERHARSCRIILVAASACRVSAAIRSRCALVRVPAPSDAEVAAAVDAAARAEGVSAAEHPPSLALRIASEAAGNARKALLLLEAHCVRQRSAKQQQQQQQMPTIGAAADAIVLERAEWEEYVAGLAMDVAQEQTPRRLAEARMKVYELLTHCIPPEVVLRRLLAELLRKVDSQLQHDLVRWAAFYEHRMRQGTKPIYHIEAFLARFMGAYSAFLLQAFA